MSFILTALSYALSIIGAKKILIPTDIAKIPIPIPHP